MKKRTYFDTYDGDGWPNPSWLERYFLTAAGQRQFFASGNDSWGLKAEGVDGTEHLAPDGGRIDVNLTILGHPDLGVLLFYHKSGGGQPQACYSKGDLMRLHQRIKTVHDLMPVGLFIPFASAWPAVKDFIETEGALSPRIAWIANKDLPPNTFPEP